jgi:predicted HAD superfamily Cof-like phosphohydrolase
VGVMPAIAPDWLIDSRANLLREEAGELSAAILAGDRSAIAREMADLVYVTIGGAVAFGLLPRTYDIVLTTLRTAIGEADRTVSLIRTRAPGVGTGFSRIIMALWDLAERYQIDLLVAVQEVHRANMTKLRPTDASMGKAIKPPGYVAPDMSLAFRR